MRLVFTAAKLISVWLFVILVSSDRVVAQSKVDGVSISLSVSSTEFTHTRKPRASVTILNRSGATISLKSFVRLSFELQLKGKPLEGDCRIDECFGTGVSLGRGQLANNDSVTVPVKLYDLYWHNSLSSIHLMNSPRNLFTHVPAGTYELYAVLSAKAENWTPGDPRFFEIKSNVVPQVTISRGK
jgi:hypothetical protein